MVQWYWKLRITPVLLVQVFSPPLCVQCRRENVRRIIEKNIAGGNLATMSAFPRLHFGDSTEMQPPSTLDMKSVWRRKVL
jgi:hypothetical protein